MKKFLRWIKRLFASKPVSSHTASRYLRALMDMPSRPVWIDKAIEYYGIKEIHGSNDHPDIVYFHKNVVGRDWHDEVPWCASFVGSVLKDSACKFMKSARARSYEKYGRKAKYPQLGDIIVFWRGSLGSGKGHVGFFIKEQNGKVLVLGGNQRNMVCFSWYGKSRLRGYYRPLKLKGDK